MSGFWERGGGWVAAQVGLAVLYGGVVLAWRRQDLPLWLTAAGALVAVAGAAQIVAGFVHLGRNLTPYPEPLPGGALVDAGVYGLVRHPIYGGIGICAVGLALALGSPAALVVGLLLGAFFRLKAAGEERRLESAYPAYAEYRARVPAMLIPWLL